jgi:DNA end-binding protein Ku
VARSATARKTRPRADAEARAARSRAFWSGTITFGLVSVPVDLFPANRGGRQGLRMLGPEGTPLRRVYVDPESGEEVPVTRVLRGYPLDGDRVVIVEDEELEALAPDKSRDIDLRHFVDATAIDPLYFQRAYFLAPAGESVKAYRLLAAVMEDTGRAGIARFVMRGTEYLVAILAEGGILRAETLRFADEIRTPESIGLPEPRKTDRPRVKRFERRIAKLAEGRLDRGELVDEESRRLRKLAEGNLEHGEGVVEVEPEETGGAEIIDLMAALKRSLEGAEGGSGRRRPARRSPARRRSGPPLEELSKEQLYERAQKLDVEGRSSMTKDQLVRALRRAG